MQGMSVLWNWLRGKGGQCIIHPTQCCAGFLACLWEKGNSVYIVPRLKGGRLFLHWHTYEQSHSTSTAKLISNVCPAHPLALWVLLLVMVASTGLYLLGVACLLRTTVRSIVQWPASSSAPPHATTKHTHMSAKYFHDSPLALIPFFVLVCFVLLCWCRFS